MKTVDVAAWVGNHCAVAGVESNLEDAVLPSIFSKAHASGGGSDTTRESPQKSLSRTSSGDDKLIRQQSQPRQSHNIQELTRGRIRSRLLEALILDDESASCLEQMANEAAPTTKSHSGYCDPAEHGFEAHSRLLQSTSESGVAQSTLDNKRFSFLSVDAVAGRYTNGQLEFNNEKFDPSLSFLTESPKDDFLTKEPCPFSSAYCSETGHSTEHATVVPAPCTWGPVSPTAFSLRQASFSNLPSKELSSSRSHPSRRAQVSRSLSRLQSLTLSESPSGSPAAATQSGLIPAPPVKFNSDPSKSMPLRRSSMASLMSVIQSNTSGGSTNSSPYGTGASGMPPGVSPRPSSECSPFHSIMYGGTPSPHYPQPPAAPYRDSLSGLTADVVEMSENMEMTAALARGMSSSSSVPLAPRCESPGSPGVLVSWGPVSNSLPQALSAPAKFVPAQGGGLQLSLSTRRSFVIADGQDRPLSPATNRPTAPRPPSRTSVSRQASFRLPPVVGGVGATEGGLVVGVASRDAGGDDA